MRRIKTPKNVASNEIQFLGHFHDFAIMLGTSIIEAIGQSASILFSRTSGKGMNPREIMALAAVNDMRFLGAGVTGSHLQLIDVNHKMTGEAALIEGVARVEDTVVTLRQADLCPKDCVKMFNRAAHLVARSSIANRYSAFLVSHGRS